MEIPPIALKATLEISIINLNEGIISLKFNISKLNVVNGFSRLEQLQLSQAPVLAYNKNFSRINIFLVKKTITFYTCIYRINFDRS
jgi:hypothetical protein